MTDKKNPADVLPLRPHQAGYIGCLKKWYDEKKPAHADMHDLWARTWLDEFDAARFAGKTTRTLRRWRQQELLRARPDVHGVMRYNKLSLMFASMAAQYNYRNRPFVAGPGRGHKKEKVVSA
ncbi:hypothetical protein [Rhodococcus sp. JVH1]|uniref:hypothetical protein n=1 Tax=Rhodococcus sp. JVH1 TaxID=745408 RepID=UPI0002721CFC|nr:hypothetical protein [Rhodococcus sp. JVH1]EJI96928.1 hypothetical protein JVH1_5605 [Rhodococcus sp. JVH1]